MSAGQGFEGNAAGPAFMVTTNRGFRDWKLTRGVRHYDNDFPGSVRDRWALRSLVMSYRWRPGTNTAACQALPSARECPGYPTTRCGCGIYAYYAPDHWHTLGDAYEPVVSGVVEGWGRCVVADKGFRAEHARILGLVVHRSGISNRWLENMNLNRRVGTFVVRDVLGSLMPDVPIFDDPRELVAAFPLAGRPT